MTLLPPGREATGAVASAGCLYVASIKVDSDGRIRLVKSRSGEVRLHERGQLSLQMFAKFASRFLERRNIEQLALICSPEAGSHMARASTYKIEAVLQLLPVTVELVTSAAISQFASKAEAHPPAPDKDRLSRDGCKYQARAILAALHHLHVQCAIAEAEVKKAQSSQAPFPVEAESREQEREREQEEERRRAVAQKSRRARDRRSQRRLEARLEAAAAAALKEQLEFEEEQRRKGVRPKRMTRLERLDAEMRAQYEKEAAVERKPDPLELLQKSRAEKARPENAIFRDWIHEI